MEKKPLTATQRALSRQDAGLDPKKAKGYNKQVAQNLSKELIHNLDSVQINQLLFSVSIGNDVYVECDHLSEVKQTLSESTLLFDILMKYLSIYKSIKNVLAKKHSKLLSHKTIIFS